MQGAAHPSRNPELRGAHEAVRPQQAAALPHHPHHPEGAGSPEGPHLCPLLAGQQNWYFTSFLIH